MDDQIKEDDLVKVDDDGEDLVDFDMNNVNNSGDNNSEHSAKGKKPRGSRYRGVSRNGNQWQVKININFMLGYFYYYKF